MPVVFDRAQRRKLLNGQNTKSVSSFNGQSSYLDYFPTASTLGRVKIHVVHEPDLDPHEYVQSQSNGQLSRGFMELVVA